MPLTFRKMRTRVAKQPIIIQIVLSTHENDPPPRSIRPLYYDRHVGKSEDLILSPSRGPCHVSSAGILRLIGSISS